MVFCRTFKCRYIKLHLTIEVFWQTLRNNFRLTSTDINNTYIWPDYPQQKNFRLQKA